MNTITNRLQNRIADLYYRFQDRNRTQSGPQSGPQTGNMHRYVCEMDLALTYAMPHPGLARVCVLAAIEQAETMKRPDLRFAAHDLLGQVSR